MIPSDCELDGGGAFHQLLRPFKIIAFDWDGTAVMSRREEATPVRELLERLLALGVYAVVTTGTNFPNIDRQLSVGISGPHKQHLYISTKRGSEVYGFDAGSRPVLLWQRVATPEEERRLPGGNPYGAAVRLLPRPLPDTGKGAVSPFPRRPTASSRSEKEGAGWSGRSGSAYLGAVPDSLHLPATRTADPTWLLIENGFSLAREHEVESLFALANGYVGTRGALAEGSPHSVPATFVAGVFDVNPQSGSVPELFAAPDWMRLRLVVDGHELKLEEGDLLEHRRMLDLRQGMLWREWRHRDPAGRVTYLRFLRLASLADRHVLLQSVTITPENYSGRLLLESQFEQAVGGEGAYLSMTPGLVPMPPGQASAGSAPTPPRVVAMALHTQGRGISVAFATASQLRTEEGERVERQAEFGAEGLVERWDWEAEIGKSYRLDRLVSVYTSRDVERPAESATRHLERRLGEGVDGVVAAHVRAWESRWQAADVEVEGDEEAQRALRFAVYHLISAANPEDERVSIGARALTGQSYKGHVFWDTEIYMLPFYVFTYPSAARALLMYRYHTLPAAREKARRLGYRGALYAWESADTGEEVTPPFVLAPDGEVIRIFSGQQEHHISADVAYAVWQYWQASGDDEFFQDAGAEIVLETARFWASRGQLEEDGCYHIRQVIGPDEYHEGVDDNAYTNVMAQWNLERGVETARFLAEDRPERWRDLARRLGIAPEEPQEWQRLAEVTYTGFDPQTGLFEQFRGYFDLEEIDLTAYEDRTVPMDVLLGRERIQRTKVAKQADVVLLIYLLWDRFPPQVCEANFRYYEPRSGHGSSLSPSVHALVAARLGDLALAERYFQQAAEIDLANNMGNAAGGVHAAALGGLWQAVVFGFAGMQLRPGELTFAPHLPPRWRSLRFSVQQKGQMLLVSVGGEPPTIEVRAEAEGIGAGGQKLATGDEPEADG